jgi:hypothetical protein
VNKEITKTQKLIEKFIEIHKDNWKYYYDDHLFLKSQLSYYELKPFKYQEKYRETFTEARKKIVDNLKRCDPEELKTPFVFYYHKGNSILPLRLPEYLNILEESSDVLEYWKKLKKTGYQLFTLIHKENLEDFCNNHILANVLRTVNIKDFKLDHEKPFAYGGEKEEIDDTEKFWEEGHHWQAIDKLNTVFESFYKYFSEKHLNKKLVFKGKKKPEQIEEIIEALANRYKVPAIKNNLNGMAIHFKFMRDKLKPKVEHEKDVKVREGYDELPKAEIRLFTRISIDLAKTLHNVFVILEKEKPD